MTEEEWLHGVKLTPLMNWLLRRGTERQFYLAGCAAVRAIWDQLPEQPYQDLILVVEQYADGLVSQEILSQAHRAAGSTAFNEKMELYNRGLSARQMSKRMAPIYAAVHASQPNEGWAAAFSAMQTATGAGRRAAAWACQCAILRDIFGNPFQPAPAVAPAWLTWNDGTVPKLAQSIYEERAFDRLPILADALEEAGCGNSALLDHCRQPAEHVRGCWVIDSLLGKTDSRPAPAKPARSRVRQGRNRPLSWRTKNQPQAVILPMVRPR